MASDSPPATPGPGHARDALDALDRDHGRLADRITTPRWYHPIVAGLTAAAAVAPALPGSWSVAVLAAFVVLVCTLPVLARRGGIAMSERPSGRATRLLLGLQVATLLVFMVVSAAVRMLGLGVWWAVPIALVVFVLVLLLGRRYDRARYAELSHQDRPR